MRGLVSEEIGAVGAFEGSVDTLEAIFAGGVKAFVCGGGVSGCTDGTGRRELAELFVVCKQQAVAALGVAVDGEVVFKVTRGVKEDNAADGKGFDGLVYRDGEDHGGHGLSMADFEVESHPGDWQSVNWG